jgi:hypothetical protein
VIADDVFLSTTKIANTIPRAPTTPETVQPCASTLLGHLTLT